MDVIILCRRRHKKRDVNKKEEDGVGNGGDKLGKVNPAPPKIGHDVMAVGCRRDV